MVLNIFYREQDLKVKYTSILLTNYYEIHRTNSPKGELATFKSSVPEGNLWKIEKTMGEVIDLVKVKNFSAYIEFWEIERYVQIRYEDIFGETYNEIYFIRESGPYIDYIKFPKVAREEIIEDYKWMMKQGLYLSCSGLSPESLYEKWLMAIQEANKRSSFR